MADRGLIVTEHEARAYAENRLGLLVRPIKPQPEVSHIWESLPGYEMTVNMVGGYIQFRHTIPHNPAPDDILAKSPLGVPGDQLIFREKWAAEKQFDWTKPRYLPRKYPFGDNAHGMNHACIWYSNELHTIKRFSRGPETHGKIRSPATMPLWAARFRPTVASVKAKRLQEITEAEAIAAGVEYLFDGHVIGMTKPPNEYGYRNYLWHGLIGNGISGKQSDAWEWQYSNYDLAKGSFSSLWQSRYGDKYPWDNNPWAFVAEITRTESKTE